MGFKRTISLQTRRRGDAGGIPFRRLPVDHRAEAGTEGPVPQTYGGARCAPVGNQRAVGGRTDEVSPSMAPAAWAAAFGRAALCRVRVRPARHARVLPRVRDEGGGDGKVKPSGGLRYRSLPMPR